MNFTKKLSKRGQFLFSFIFITNCFFSQNQPFYEKLEFKANYEIKNLTNNTYFLIRNCFFNKASNNEIVWGYSKLKSNYFYNSLNVITNKIDKINIELKEFNLTPSDKKNLEFYGITNIISSKLFTVFDIGNTLFFLKKENKKLVFEKTITIHDSIEYTRIFSNSDSTLILLDYKPTFEGISKIKAYHFNKFTNKINLFFQDNLSSNSSCFDMSTKYFDSNNLYFLITDDLDYKITLFNSDTKKLYVYCKPLAISEKSRKALNPNKQIKGVFDTVLKELKNTPRIINTQFINDSDIIVNYCIKPDIEKNGISIKNSMIDLLTIRNDVIILKNTYDDSFIYEQLNFNKTGKVEQGKINPQLRNSFFYFIQNNHLINITFKEMIPKSNCRFDKYVRKVKFSTFNLKSKLIYTNYEFRL